VQHWDDELRRRRVLEPKNQKNFSLRGGRDKTSVPESTGPAM
jgi:hypothetical protein